MKKTIRTIKLNGSILLPDSLTDKDFYSIWYHFLKQNDFKYSGNTSLEKEVVEVDNSDEPELPF